MLPMAITLLLPLSTEEVKACCRLRGVNTLRLVLISSALKTRQTVRLDTCLLAILLNCSTSGNKGFLRAF